jgi:hypothetical protein
MSAFNLQRIIVILIIVTLSASSFIGLANSTAAEPESRGGAATRAGPETYMVYSSGGTQVYYVPFTGTSFGAPQLLSNQAGSNYGNVIADFDNDGDYDVIFSKMVGSTLEFHLVKKTGAGNSFGTPTRIGTIPSASLAVQIAAGDINNDNRMDFVASKWYNSNDMIYVFLNQGSDTFSSQQVYSGGSYISGKTLVDFDMDGRLDLLADIDYSDSNLHWFRGDGKGGFSAPMLIGPKGGTSVYMFGTAAGDFDKNGRNDVIFVPWGTATTWYTYMYEGELGAHKFGSYEGLQFPSGNWVSFNSAYDFDGDGYEDIAYNSLSTNQLFWVKNNGHGAFSNPTLISNGVSFALGIAVPTDFPEDADNDNFPDYWENLVGLDTSNPNEADLDPDSDGLTNRQELENGSDPNNPDTDGDGLNDYTEVVIYKTDPGNPDSDFDGLNDYKEKVTFGISTSVKDTDSGDMYDGVEGHSFFNTDPTNPDDDPIKITDQTQVDAVQYDQPDVATDSNHNVHMAFTRVEGSNFELYYKMTTPAGTDLIAQTRITNDDNRDSMRPQINVDSNNNVHITWMDMRNTGRISIYYIKLDPFADDRDGDSANKGTITIVWDKLITSDISDINWQTTVHRMTIDSKDRLNILVPNSAGAGQNPPGLYLIQLDFIGNPTMNPALQRISDTYGESMSQDLAVDSNDDIHLTYNLFEGDGSSRTAAPVATWNMDENSGTIIYDSTNSNDGTLGSVLGTDRPTWTTGVSGSALSFDGIDDYVQVPNHPTIEVGSGNSDFAVEFWFYLRQDPVGQWRSLMHKGNSNLQRTFAMWMRPWDNRIHYRISTSSYWNEGGDSVTAIQKNTWTHIAYVRNGNTVQLYINGALDHYDVLGGSVNSNNGPFYIGKDPWYAFTTDFIIDELSIYRGTVSPQQVYNHYANQPQAWYKNRGTQYMMVDGTDASTIIDRTEISLPIPNGGQEIDVDSNDKVHIVWHQEDMVSSFPPTSCIVEGSSQNVLNEVSTIGDGNVAPFTNGALIAEWTNIPASQKTLTLVMRSEGDYQDYDVTVWDGSSWAPLFPVTSEPDGTNIAFQLNAFLPDPTGKIRVKLEHVVSGPVGWGIMMDFLGMKMGNWLFPAVETFYTKLDPSLDDQNGDSSTDGILTLVPDKRVSEADDVYSMWPTITIDTDDMVHIPWFEQSDWDSQAQDLVFAVHDNHGMRETPIIPLTMPGSDEAGSTRYGNYYPTFAYVTTDGTRSNIVWCDVSSGTNIYLAWMNPDDDHDRLSLFKEFDVGTDFMNPDTDDDDLLDGEEVYDWFTDPLDPDTDNDLLKDGPEVLDYLTDPFDIDTDNGGIPDGEEVLLFFTDPLDPADDVFTNEAFNVVLSLEQQDELDGSDTSSWTYGSLWHKVYDGTSLGIMTSIFNITYAGLWAWWYGIEATGTYETGGQTFGSLITPNIQVPSNYNELYFTFWTLWQIESSDPSSYDLMDVYLLTNGGATRMHVLSLNPENDPPNGATNLPLSSGTGVSGIPMWVFHAIDVSAYQGQIVQFEFEFDSGDGLYNNFQGWYVDNMQFVNIVPPVEEEEVEVREKPGINIGVEIVIPGGPTVDNKVTYTPGKGLESEDIEIKGKKEEKFILTPLDLFLIFFIIILAATLVTTLQVQKKRMESMIKSKCVSGEQTRLLDVSDQMRESMDAKKAGRISAGNMVEILDVKGNMVEIATEIGSFLVPADFLSCAEGMEELEIDRDKKKDLIE